MTELLRPLPSLKNTIESYGIRTKKSLGQHFLLDGNITDRIVRAAGNLNKHTVIEVGPGPGGLTRSIIAAKPVEIFVLEKDERCIPALSALLPYTNCPLHVMEADAMHTHAEDLGQAPRALISNLPYNVGTQLLINWLKAIYHNPACLDRLVLMFQKEVALRIVAPEGTRAFGRLSVLANWLCETRMVMQVPAGAFSPPPKVDSAVVQLIPYDKPTSPAKLELLEKVVAAAFQQRRKMLRSSLKSLGGEFLQAAHRTGIDLSLRAEDLDIDEFTALARLLENTAAQ